MYQKNMGYNAYKNNSVNLASKEQLLLMLLDGAVKFSKVAREAIINKDIPKAHNNLIKVQDIFCELIATLDVQKGGKWAEDIRKVYFFINDRLIQANLKKDVKILDEVIPLIEDVRDTWEQAYKMSKEI